MKKILLGAILFGSVIGLGHTNGYAFTKKPIDPATCAYYQAAYYQATGQTITCDQLTQMWYNGTYWPK